MPMPAIARQTMTPSGVRAKSAMPQALMKKQKKPARMTFSLPMKRAAKGTSGRRRKETP